MAWKTRTLLLFIPQNTLAFFRCIMFSSWKKRKFEWKTTDYLTKEDQRDRWLQEWHCFLPQNMNNYDESELSKLGRHLYWTNQNECELEQLIKVVNDLPKLIVHIIEGQCEQGQLDLFGHLKVFEPVTLSSNELFLPVAVVIRYVSFNKLKCFHDILRRFNWKVVTILYYENGIGRNLMGRCWSAAV